MGDGDYIPGRRTAEGPAYAKALELEGAYIWEKYIRLAWLELREKGHEVIKC